MQFLSLITENFHSIEFTIRCDKVKLFSGKWNQKKKKNETKRINDKLLVEINGLKIVVVGLWQVWLKRKSFRKVLECWRALIKQKENIVADDGNIDNVSNEWERAKLAHKRISFQHNSHYMLWIEFFLLHLIPNDIDTEDCICSASVHLKASTDRLRNRQRIVMSVKEKCVQVSLNRRIMFHWWWEKLQKAFSNSFQSFNKRTSNYLMPGIN